MTEKSVRFYMSVPTARMDEIDKLVEELNIGKNTWQADTKRQDVIRAFIRYCLKKGIKLESHYGKGCYAKVEGDNVTRY